MFNLKSFLNLNYYTSELDKFLADYNKKHPKMTASQREEYEKYQRIAKGLVYDNDMDGRSHQ